jgi:hypothetical protein
MLRTDQAVLMDIRCPNCGTEFPVTDVLHHQIAEHCDARVRDEVARQQRMLAAKESNLQAREAAIQRAEEEAEDRLKKRLESERELLEAKIRAETRADLEVEITDLRSVAAEHQRKVNQLQQTEMQLRKDKRELEEQKHAAEAHFEQQVEERLSQERHAIEERAFNQAVKRVRTDVEIEIADLRAEAAEKDRKLKDAQQAELELRREKRELEAQKQALALEVNRRVDAERTKIREEAQREADEAHRLKDAEKDRKLQDAIRVNDELRRKLQQGSQQTQGEVLENTLEEFLKAQFPFDSVEPVANGVHGGDVLQRVYSRSGHCCGAILWESKNTKNWNNAWIDKVKDDQRDAKADVAVVVSTALPKDVSGCACREGVWLTEARLVLGLATALRNGLLEVAATKRAVAGKNEAIEVLFAYLTGPEFRQRIEAIVRTFGDMQGDLEEEKRVAARRWAKREKQIARVVENTSAMCGDLQGLLGAAMPSIPSLEPGEQEPVRAPEAEIAVRDDDIRL